MKQFLQDTLVDKIPVATAMAIHVADADAQGVTLKAPLEGNTNHQGTGFGGSIYSIAVLSGWALLTAWLKQEEIDASVVIKTATIDYRRPVEGELSAMCRFGDVSDRDRMSVMLARKGRARISLSAVVLVAGEEAAVLQGEYVILKSGGD